LIQRVGGHGPLLFSGGGSRERRTGNWRFGAKVRSFDAAKAKDVKAVVDVVAFATPVTNGVAVLAKDFWAAKQGRDALTVQYCGSGAHPGGGVTGAGTTPLARSSRPAPALLVSSLIHANLVLYRFSSV
jgi:hypothetical protein